MNTLKPVVLASRSPRRLVLLEQIGIRPVVMPSDVDETFDSNISPQRNAIVLAEKKATAVSEHRTDAFVVGADTIVVLDGELLAKPSDTADAGRMLRQLSGRTHIVVTGLSIVHSASSSVISDCETTLVTFRDLPEEEIAAYVAGGSPMDKAGAYGIQDDYGAVFVTRIEGCFYNVVGFPLAKFYHMLKRIERTISERQRTGYVKENQSTGSQSRA